LNGFIARRYSRRSGHNFKLHFRDGHRAAQTLSNLYAIAVIYAAALFSTSPYGGDKTSNVIN
jgi:hypothetical protein